MAVRIAVANHKGGVGKSTSAMMLAEGLAHYGGLRVLVFDLDPQASLSAMLLSSPGVEAVSRKGQTLWDLLKAIGDAQRVQVPRFVTTKASDLTELRDAQDHRRVDLVASCSDLLSEYAERENAIRKRHSRTRIDVALANALDPELQTLDHSYDVILFDCPATAAPLGLAAIRLSNILISPTVLDDISLRALRDFVAIILKDDLQMLGRLADFRVLATMHVRSNPEQRFILDQMRAGAYKLRALRHPVGHSVAVQRSVSRLRPDAYRTVREKYDSALEDVHAISREVWEMISQVGGKK